MLLLSYCRQRALTWQAIRKLSPRTATGCGTQHPLRYRLRLAGRCPNSFSLFSAAGSGRRCCKTPVPPCCLRQQGPTPRTFAGETSCRPARKTVLIRDGIHLHSEYSSRLQKGYFGVKVLFVNKKRTKPESKKAAGCVVALLKRVRTQRRPV